MTDATRRYRDRMARQTDANVDRWDPAKLLESLKLQSVPVVRIQFRTLLWDCREQMERHLRAAPELSELFINLVRADLENPA